MQVGGGRGPLEVCCAVPGSSVVDGGGARVVLVVDGGGVGWVGRGEVG